MKSSNTVQAITWNGCQGQSHPLVRVLDLIVGVDTSPEGDESRDSDDICSNFDNKNEKKTSKEEWDEACE